MRPPGSAGTGFEQIPEILRDIPRAAITPEALTAAREGRCPFGPPPLIERRSGIDRRAGNDRRQSTELVFRNMRYGGDRRARGDRRRNPPPYRDPSRLLDECLGNPELRALSWMPDAVKKPTPPEE